MFNIEDTVYAALKSDAAITSAVGTRIFHNGVQDGGSYPSVWYGEISNVPALNADDEEEYSRATFQVSILSLDGAVNDIARAVESVMLTLGFVRQSYTAFNDGKVRTKAMRFVIAGKGE